MNSIYLDEVAGQKLVTWNEARRQLDISRQRMSFLIEHGHLASRTENDVTYVLADAVIEYGIEMEKQSELDNR